jgi:hypothetical protein
LYSKTGQKNGVWTEKNTLDPQGVGSIITYYRRYNLLMLLDLQVQDDDWVGGSNRAKQKSYETNIAQTPKDGDVICDKCGSKMVEKQWPYGKFYWCSNYQGWCKNIKKI